MDTVINQVIRLRGELDKIRVQGNESVMAAATCYLLCDNLIETLRHTNEEKDGDVCGTGN